MRHPISLLSKSPGYSRLSARLPENLKKRMKLAYGVFRDPTRAPPGLTWFMWSSRTWAREEDSPLICERDIHRALVAQPPVAAIDLAADDQIALMGKLSAYWQGVPDEPRPGWRYHSSPMFPASDATVYYGLLQYLRPAGLIEVGSGFTSALALDTRARHLRDLVLTFIEPHPEVRLNGLLSHSDREECQIISRPVQEVPLELFDQLGPGDVLFIDTTHIVKTGSEVNWLIFNVLPRLAAGVIVHVHDISWPFEYPIRFLKEGRSYNELYFLRAFLMFNRSFSIMLFSNWMWQHHRQLFTGIPADYGGEPGSLWLRKVEGPSLFTDR